MDRASDFGVASMRTLNASDAAFNDRFQSLDRKNDLELVALEAEQAGRHDLAAHARKVANMTTEQWLNWLKGQR